MTTAGRENKDFDKVAFQREFNEMLDNLRKNVNPKDKNENKIIVEIKKFINNQIKTLNLKDEQQKARLKREANLLVHPDKISGVSKGVSAISVDNLAFLRDNASDHKVYSQAVQAMFEEKPEVDINDTLENNIAGLSEETKMKLAEIYLMVQQKQVSTLDKQKLFLGRVGSYTETVEQSHPDFKILDENIYHKLVNANFDSVGAILKPQIKKFEAAKKASQNVPREEARPSVHKTTGSAFGGSASSGPQTDKKSDTSKDTLKEHKSAVKDIRVMLEKYDHKIEHPGFLRHTKSNRRDMLSDLVRKCKNLEACNDPKQYKVLEFELTKALDVYSTNIKKEGMISRVTSTLKSVCDQGLKKMKPLLDAHQKDQLDKDHAARIKAKKR